MAAIAQPFGIVACHDQLQRGEEGLNKDLLLIVQVLPNALAHRDG